LESLTRDELIARLYRAFNARDIDSVLAQMTPDVDWPNGWEGGRILGRAEVRAYWQRQWAEIDPHVEPVRLVTRADGLVEVTVHQVVHDTVGQLLTDEEVVHLYEFDADLIRRMTLEG
jgi:hypothetical protein